EALDRRNVPREGVECIVPGDDGDDQDKAVDDRNRPADHRPRSGVGDEQHENEVEHRELAGRAAECAAHKDEDSKVEDRAAHDRFDDTDVRAENLFPGIDKELHVTGPPGDTEHGSVSRQGSGYGPWCLEQVRDTVSCGNIRQSYVRTGPTS